MMVVQDIVAQLECIAPGHLAEDWDNTGLLVGRCDAKVNRLLTCLTLTSDVAEEAISEKVQLVVTHHPVLFHGAKRITGADQEGRVLLKLIENGVAVYSPHTSFDSSSQGINQQLATGFGLQGIRPVQFIGDDPDVGVARHGTLAEAVSLQVFLKTVRGGVAAKYLEYTGELKAPVHHVAVACGAASGVLTDAVALGCDTFVTGEARFHAALEAREAGVNLILLGH
jgi:dinuclear metal center YbgI/SA1388 family protein